MPFIKIDNTLIGTGQPPFIVAEAGINHNGDLETAFKMIETAKKARVDAIKFQTFKAEEFIGETGQTYTYVSNGKKVTESMLEMFRRYELKRDEWFLIKEKCDKEEILFLSTPQNRSDLDLLLEVGISAIKVGSDDFTNLPLLNSYSEARLPIILSCGMSNLAEIYQSLETVGALDGYPTILLLCTSQYPTPPEDVNLLRIKTLSSAFPMLPLGFSDHTQSSLASSLGMALGACVFEKHFTLSHDLPGPDQWFSVDPEELREWRKSIWDSYTMLGNGIVRPTKAEEEMKAVARRSIVALSEINEGDLLTDKNIGMKRPGNGLPSSMFNNLLGLNASRSIKKGNVLKLGDFRY